MKLRRDSLNYGQRGSHTESRIRIGKLLTLDSRWIWQHLQKYDPHLPEKKLIYSDQSTTRVPSMTINLPPNITHFRNNWTEQPSETNNNSMMKNLKSNFGCKRKRKTNSKTLHPQVEIFFNLSVKWCKELVNTVILISICASSFSLFFFLRFENLCALLIPCKAYFTLRLWIGEEN